MKLARTLSAAALAATLALTGTAALAADADPNTTVAFRDDFNGVGLPSSAWQIIEGTSYPGGPANFGTGQVDRATRDLRNVQQRGGFLEITPQLDGGEWTSARIETNEAFFPAEGQIMRSEASLALPDVHGEEARGYWPAFWMLGSGYRDNRWSWPAPGELDIAESVNGHDWVASVLHCGYSAQWGGPCNEPTGRSSGIGLDCTGSDCWGNQHLYAVEWDRSQADEEIRFYVDGRQRLIVKQSDLPVDVWASMTAKAYYIILNVAINGAFPVAIDGNATDKTKPGVPMRVDYVQVSYRGDVVEPPVDPEDPPVDPEEPPVDPEEPPTCEEPPVDPEEPPAGVSNLHPTEITSDHITLVWDGDPNATYALLRGGVQIQTVKGLTATDSGLLGKTPYVLSVRNLVTGETTDELTITTP